MRSIVLPLVLVALFIPSRSLAQLPEGVDLLLEHDEANAQLHVFLRANTYEYVSIVSSLSLTVRWPVASAATLGFGSSAWCPYPNAAFQPSPASMVTPGNGYNYRNWTYFGLSTMISDLIDDGGCENTLLADTWTEAFTIPVNNDLGGTVFDVATDQYAVDNNLLYFVSLQGVDLTGDVYSGTTLVQPPAQVENGFTLYPDPATTTTTITLNDASLTAWQYVMIDASGRTVRNGRGTAVTETIDLTTVANGVYQMNVRAGDRQWTRALVVQHP